jgi:TRAP-type C4-dicarboxylate transport system permease small subunit
VLKMATTQESPVGAAPQPADGISYSKYEFWLYLAVILFLGIIVLIALISAICLQAHDKSIPEFIVSIGSVAIGTLAGVLAPSPTKPKAG